MTDREADVIEMVRGGICMNQLYRENCANEPCAACLDKARAALSTLESRGYGKIPDGWQLIPEQPTSVMLGAARRLVSELTLGGDMTPLYRTMLAVAPSPPEGKG